MSNPIFNLNGRVWIETADEKILGRGRAELLERIQASGSIRQAALQMKMSYKQAWDLVNHMNERFGQPLVISHRGGKGGGNAVVTDHGLKVIKQFHLLEQKLQEFLKENTQNLTL
jgi:molybdate transport system regulatory protein